MGDIEREIGRKLVREIVRERDRRERQALPIVECSVVPENPLKAEKST